MTSAINHRFQHKDICVYWLIQSYKDLQSVLSDLSQKPFWEALDIRLQYLKRSAVISLKGLPASSPSFCCCSVDLKREIARYRAGLASAPIAGFMVMYNKHNLSLEDLGTLEEQNWINDQV